MTTRQVLPDPNFNDPSKWGGTLSIVGGQLIADNENGLIMADPLLDIGGPDRMYHYTINLSSLTQGGIEFFFGGTFFAQNISEGISTGFFITQEESNFGISTLVLNRGGTPTLVPSSFVLESIHVERAMINVSNISEALQTILQNNAALSAVLASRSPVSRGDYINNRPDNVPWVGVYRSEVIYDPRTLGDHPSSWQGIVTIKVVAQETSLDSGQDCEEKLEALVTLVLDALLEDRTLAGNVDMLNNMGVQYSYNETDRESIFFQNATLTLEYEVSTG